MHDIRSRDRAPVESVRRLHASAGARHEVGRRMGVQAVGRLRCRLGASNLLRSSNKLLLRRRVMDNKRRDQLIVATLCDQIKLVEDWQEKGTFRAFLHGQNVSEEVLELS